MLQKFLFVGVGGSGGKTLRFLREDLERRLERTGWSGAFPEAWQFVQIDVPAVPDGTEPSLPPQLPSTAYVPLSVQGLAYDAYRSIAEKRSPEVEEELASWAPDPRAVNFPLEFGAGQYRAIGRVVAAAGMEKIVEALRRALAALRHVEVDVELRSLSEQFGAPLAPSTPAPMAIVISSIAGGAGAGAVLDVCDALRHLGVDGWPDNSIGILYTPDVFAALGSDGLPGVQPNALAVLSEIMAAQFNSTATEEGELAADTFAVLEASGVSARPVRLRGPKYPFLVGRENNKVAFGHPHDVYRSVARSLAAWTTSLQVQDAVRAYLFGNLDAARAQIGDTLGLGSDGVKSFSSLGYASVGLGRDRFARYTTQRLSRHALEHLQRAHWTDQVPDFQTPAAALEQAAQDNFYPFLEACGLRELGTDHNQILDAIRGGDEHQARLSALSDVRQAIVRDVTHGKREMKATDVVQAIDARLHDRWHAWANEQEAGDETRAESWVRETQARVTRAVAVYLGRVGAPTVLRLLELALAELRSAVVPELAQMTEARQRMVATTQQRIRGALAGYDGKLLPGNPLINTASKEATDSLWEEVEARLYRLASRLILDLSDNLLQPLRTAVDRAYEELEEGVRGTAAKPSIVDDWPTGPVPTALEPAQNEIQLEPVSGYPRVFEDQLRATTGLTEPVNARLRAIREIIVGTDDTDGDGQTVVESVATWVPRPDTLRTSEVAQAAAFRVRLKPNHLLERSQRWVNRPDTSFGLFVNESLAGYLAPNSATPAAHDERLSQFGSAFRQALAVSLPLLGIDPRTLHLVHETDRVGFHRVMTELPFDKDHPARSVARELLANDNSSLTSDDLDRYFHEGSSARIEMSTFFLGQYHPMVFNSVMKPIADDWAIRRNSPDLKGFWRWRRARPLDQFVPTSADVRRAMVRGWFVARVLNQIECRDPVAAPVAIRIPGGKHLPFPFPLLGSQITQMHDLLPAVLESLPIALTVLPNAGIDAMRPYQRLIELGRPVRGYAVSSSTLPEVLHGWVVDGKLDDGLPEPRPEDAGTAAREPEAARERLAAVLEFIRRYAEYFEHTVGPRGPDGSLSRAWELRRDILLALRELDTMARRTGETTEGLW